MADAPAPQGRNNRRLKNFLLDPKYQARLTLRVVTVAMAMAGLVFVALVRAADASYAQAESAASGRFALSDANMQLEQCRLREQLASPAMQGNSEGVAKLRADVATKNEAFRAEQQRIIGEYRAIPEAQARTAAAIGAVLLALVLLVALGSIILTHRIVGPVYRMKRLAQEVTSGHYPDQGLTLRPNDELQDLFVEYKAMLLALRARGEADLQLARAAAQGDPAALPKLEAELAARVAPTKR
jgi:hypothetical protein